MPVSVPHCWEWRSPVLHRSHGSGQEGRSRLLGLDDGRVFLVGHDPAWASLYACEERLIRSAMQRLLVDVQHFGSTSIPGIRAKPILDLMVGVRCLSIVDRYRSLLGGIGYEYQADRQVPGGAFFAKGTPRTHHLHVVEWNGWKWRQNLAFRDRLRNAPCLARSYEAEKMALASRYPGIASPNVGEGRFHQAEHRRLLALRRTAEPTGLRAREAPASRSMAGPGREAPPHPPEAMRPATARVGARPPRTPPCFPNPPQVIGIKSTGAP